MKKTVLLLLVATTIICAAPLSPRAEEGGSGRTRASLAYSW